MSCKQMIALGLIVGVAGASAFVPLSLTGADRIVLALSRTDKPALPAILNFIGATPCSAGAHPDVTAGGS